MIKVGISAVSIAGAFNNLYTEIPHCDFEKTKNETQIAWNNILNKIIIQTPNLKTKINFYTSLYHSFIAPNTFMDVDGQYAGIGQNIFKDTTFTNYSTFSLWDTYRALHPLYTIIIPEKTDDMVRSMIEHYNQNPYKCLPIWSLWGNETYCMSGVHSIPVIAEAYLKGIHSKYDPKEAYEAMKNSTNRWTSDFEQLGYSPQKGKANSVSNTLEQAFDDYAVAMMAKNMNDSKSYSIYLKRSEAFKILYDSTLQLMRPKNEKQEWMTPFKPSLNIGFSEGNSYQYTFHVQQNIQALMQLMNGKIPFEKQLDKLFNMPIDSQFIALYPDFKNGNIGFYVHANEPCNHIPYLYNYTNSPWKTQKYVTDILTNFYDTIPSGITGNEDCGQMSAWYIFSAMGFYPIDPVSCMYDLGKPIIEKTVINVENGKTFVILAKNLSSKNIYVKAVKLNGKELSIPKISHSDIINGGQLEFEMTAYPSK